jgi:hypothetical protein
MPILFGVFLSFGADRFLSWRLVMVVPGALMLLTGFLYYRFTEDTPDGRPFSPRIGGTEHFGKLPRTIVSGYSVRRLFRCWEHSATTLLLSILKTRSSSR